MIDLKEYLEWLEDRLLIITSMTLGQHFRYYFDDKTSNEIFYDKAVEIYREQSDVNALEMIKAIVLELNPGVNFCRNTLNSKG